MSTEPTNESAFFSTIRSWGIVRSDTRVIGGVLSGVGRRIGMADAPARILFVVIAIVTGGFALLVYAAAWALLPDSSGRIVIQDFGRGRPNVGALVTIVILAVFGLIFLNHGVLRNGWRALNVVGPPVLAMNYGIPHLLVLLVIVLPLLLVAGVVVLIVWAAHSSRQPQAPGFARPPDGALPDAAPAPTQADAAPASTASGPAATPPVYSAPPAYSSPARWRVPGPGKVGYLLALALIPITAAITLYLATNHRLTVFPMVAAGVIYVAGLGLILIITALRGRKLGFLGFVSVLALIPVGFAIASAPELRAHYAAGDWRDWANVFPGDYHGPEPIYTPPPAFDPSATFDDYDTVALNAMCSTSVDGLGVEPDGIVRLSSVPADQTITVTSATTQLFIPRGTGLTIVAAGPSGTWDYVEVLWKDRDVMCQTTPSASNLVQLSNAGAPVLTVRLDDTQGMGSARLIIEED